MVNVLTGRFDQTNYGISLNVRPIKRYRRLVNVLVNGLGVWVLLRRYKLKGDWVLLNRQFLRWLVQLNLFIRTVD